MTTMNSQTAKQPLQKSSPPQKSSFSQKLIALVAFALITSAFSAVARWRAAAHSKPSLYPVSAMPSFAQQQQSREQTMRFLVRRVESDPQDMSASNMLAGIYIQKVRDTGSLDYMVRAEHLAHTSLASVPAVRNTAAVAVLTQVELMEHRWTAAAAPARLLARLNAGQGYPYGLLGDALIENGDYGGATSAYLAEARLGGGVGTEARLARLAFLRGRLGEARRHYANALSFARAENVPSPESIAWCRWQLGETAFYAGDYPAAEREYRAALDMFPQYYLALASLGRVLAARGDLPAATRAYEQAINVIPSPVYVGALGDLYRLTGRSQDAAAQYALVARIQRLSKLGGEPGVRGVLRHLRRGRGRLDGLEGRQDCRGAGADQRGAPAGHAGRHAVLPRRHDRARRWRHGRRQSLLGTGAGPQPAVRPATVPDRPPSPRRPDGEGMRNAR